MSHNEEERCLRLDLTYNFQDHPILFFQSGEAYGDRICGKSCQNCPYKKECTHFESIAWANISLDTITAYFPQSYKFHEIIGAHTGQYDLSEMFKIYDFSDKMVAYGPNQRAAFRVRHEDGIVQWIGFEFECVRSEDIPVILELADCAQKCLDRPMYLCSNEGEGGSRLIPLSDKNELRHFLEDKYCKNYRE